MQLFYKSNLERLVQLIKIKPSCLKEIPVASATEIIFLVITVVALNVAVLQNSSTAVLASKVIDLRLDNFLALTTTLLCFRLQTGRMRTARVCRRAQRAHG